jgi:hypothetical protein
MQWGNLGRRDFISCLPLDLFLARLKSYGLCMHTVPANGLNNVGSMGCARVVYNLDDMGIVGMVAGSGHCLSIQDRVFDGLKRCFIKGLFDMHKEINGFHFALLLSVGHLFGPFLGEGNHTRTHAGPS